MAAPCRRPDRLRKASSVGAVDAHLRAIVRELDLHSRSELVLRVAEEGGWRWEA